MISSRERTTLLLVVLVLGVTCQPTPEENLGMQRRSTGLNEVIAVSEDTAGDHSVPDDAVIVDAAGNYSLPEETVDDAAVDTAGNHSALEEATDSVVVDAAEGHSGSDSAGNHSLPDESVVSAAVEVGKHQSEPTKVVVAGANRNARSNSELEEQTSYGTLGSPREHHELKYHKFVIIKQLISVVFGAFINAITSVIANWFWPWKVIPPIPGRLGFGQLFGGYPPPTPFYG